MPIELSLRRRPECLSDLALDQWLAADATPAQEEEWSAHAAGCAICRERREQRQAENQRYLASSRDLELAAERLRVRRLESRAQTRLAWLVAGALAAAASVALLVSMPGDTEPVATRVKGSTRLDFYVKSGGVVRPGAAGDVVRAGDALRFVVPRGEARYLVVLGRDSRAASSVYFPAGPDPARVSDDAQPIGTGVALPSSVVLDDAPGVERFYGVFCEQAPSADELRRELAALGRLVPREGCELIETHVLKAAR